MNCVFQTTFTYIISFDPHNYWEQNGTKVIIRVGNPATTTHVGTGIRTKSSEVCMLFSHCATLHSNSSIFKQFLLDVFYYIIIISTSKPCLCAIAYKKIVVHNDDLER